MSKRGSFALNGFALALVLSAAIAAGCGAQPRATPPLILERTLELANVSGRIDHLALDGARQRLFVAELGNGSVEALDIKSGRSLGRIGGLAEPQGVGYLASRDELIVATGGDGAVRFYRGADLSPIGSLVLGGDADNVRIDPAGGMVVVGFGRALAIIDPATHRLIKTIALPAHPEGFQLSGGRAFVNLPDAGGLAAVDLEAGRILARWPNPGWKFNFPMALEVGQAAVVYRLPARLALFDLVTGAVVERQPTCGDSDDVFFDAPRRRLYVICGGGAVEVFERRAHSLVSLGRIETRDGARTGLWDAAAQRLYVAARAAGGKGAAIQVLRPAD
jgi:hypothetical protein